MRILAVAFALLVAAPGTASADTTVERIAGADRFETAAALALDRYTSASDAVLARADDPADALGGAYVAGTHIGPVLLSRRDAVPQASLDALQALGVHKVRVLGGTAALGTAVVAQLEAQGYTVRRLAGPDRYATAAAVARDSGVANVGVRGDRGATAILASGLEPSDALTAGPLAYGQQWPVLLATATGLPAPAMAALDDLGVRHVVIVGGTAAVGDGVAERLRASGRTVERLAGADRERTAVAVADAILGLGYDGHAVAVAAATAVADALALGPYAAPGTPVLLCRSVDACGVTTTAWLSARAPGVTSLVIAGGPAVISERAAEELRRAAAG